jgi:hypothetical protein
MRSIKSAVSSPSIVSDQNPAPDLNLNYEDLGGIWRDHVEFRFIVEELISGQYNDSLDEVVLSMKGEAASRFNRRPD